MRIIMTLCGRSRWVAIHVQCHEFKYKQYGFKCAFLSSFVAKILEFFSGLRPNKLVNLDEISLFGRRFPGEPCSSARMLLLKVMDHSDRLAHDQMQGLFYIKSCHHTSVECGQRSCIVLPLIAVISFIICNHPTGDLI